MNGDFFQEILHTIRQNRLRSLLTVFGVFWGIFMLVILVGTGNGLQNGTYSAFGGYATNSFFLWCRTTTKPYKGYGVGRRFNFTNDDTRLLRETVPEIEVIAPRARVGGGEGANNVVYKDNTATLTIYGDEPEIKSIRLLDIIEGRFLNPLDIAEKRKVAVLGAASVPILFSSHESPVGSYIRINGIGFQIVGIFDLPNKNNERQEEDAKAIFLPLSTFQQTFHWGDRVGWFSIGVKPRFDSDRVKEKVINLMARRHQLAPDDERAFGSWDMSKEFKKISDLFTGIRFLVWFVGLFSLMAGIVGISNIMMIVVRERTGEIGIRRAVGAPPLVIVRQIVMETLLLTSIPGYTALIVGVASLETVRRGMDLFKIESQMFQEPQIGFSAALAALVVLSIGGVLAGVMPALRAIGMRPVEALRFEY